MMLRVSGPDPTSMTGRGPVDLQLPDKRSEKDEASIRTWPHSYENWVLPEPLVMSSGKIREGHFWMLELFL